ncbi:MAG TPA: hemerythrin domain-containing protein [Polyangiaceae bacterium]|nr:hemerythrin domain-containing protein [Polyangiaceae bacterium]
MNSNDTPPSPPSTPRLMNGSVRPSGVSWVADDEAIDATFVLLLRALEGQDLGAVACAWKELEAILVTHLDDEEQRVTPRIAAIQLRQALAILQEHRFLRGRLRELGKAIDGGRPCLVDARSFRDELRAHARHEADILRALPDEVASLARR